MKKNCEVDEILQAQVLSLTSNLGLPFQEKDILEALSFTGGNDIDAALDYLLTVKSSTIKTQTSPKSVEKPIEKQKVQETKNSHSLSNFESSLESSTKDEEFVGILSEEDQFELLTNHKKKTRQGYVVLGWEEIASTAELEIERISTLLEVPNSTAAALLRYFKWDSEKLIERYFDNEKKVLSESGIIISEIPPIPFSDLKEKECQICGDAFAPGNYSSLKCHTFCNTCWRGYLDVKIKEGQSLEISCMGHKCLSKVPQNIVTQLVCNDLRKKYRFFLLKSFIDNNPFTKWCPAQGCNNAIKSELQSEWCVKCNCGYKFCFKCGEEAHVPAPCDKIKEWAKKSQDESETSNWIASNTQDCPKCHTAIEKNGGCNHMTCYKCRHEFCWICLKDYKAHGVCNKYEPDSLTNKQSTRAALERYLHYFHRWNIHQQSKKFETSLREAAISKMVELRQKSNDQISVDYIEEATEQLIECRNVLMYTYVNAYYLPDGPEKVFFEYLQAELERETERLSHELESGFYNRKVLLNLTTVARKRLERLQDGVKNGLTELPTGPNPKKKKI